MSEFEEDIPFGEGDGEPEPDDRPRVEARSRVPLAALLSIADPVSTPPWPRTRSSWDVAEIRRRAAERDYGDGGHLPWILNRGLSRAEDHGPFHMARVAWLMNNEHAPEVTIGAAETITDYGDWPILDGNHRLAAAILRGDEEIDLVIHGYPGLVGETVRWLREVVIPGLDEGFGF